MTKPSSRKIKQFPIIAWIALDPNIKRKTVYDRFGIYSVAKRRVDAGCQCMRVMITPIKKQRGLR